MSTNNNDIFNGWITMAMIMYEIGATIFVVESAAGTGIAIISTISISAMIYISEY